jgi:hypothetical protein
LPIASLGKKKMFTIKVVRKDNGKPSKGERVSASLDGFFSGGVTKNEFTNSDGEAHFDYDPRNGEVYVNGRTAYKGKIEGRVIVYV